MDREAKIKWHKQEIARLEKEIARPLPDKWEVGQKVRYIRTEDWGFTEGNEAYIVEVREEDKNKKAHEYQVFFTWPDFSGEGGYWTTPDDVELVEDK